MKVGFALLGALVIVAAAALLPARPYLDFQVIYHADLGLLRGISLYDHAGQIGMIAQLANVPTSQVYVLPFPYPPWYALSTAWLATLPIDLAARTWFGLNLLLLGICLWLLTSGQQAARRAAQFTGGLLWLPVLGSLLVGQYGMPVLLGAALMIHALRRERALQVGLAAALLTFKPHLGGLVVLLVVINLAMRRNRFGRSALVAILIAAVALFCVGFLASPRWPVDYFRSLAGFRAFGNVSACEQCVSLSTALTRLAGGGLDQAVWISAIAAILLGGWLVTQWKHLTSTAGGLVVFGIIFTLLASPYLLNYDYLLLLVPFLELAREGRGSLHWIGLALAYVLPVFGLSLLGTAGSLSLIFSTCILFALGQVGANRVAVH